ncbi:PREDICTED: indole-3-acetaldehyde oxidase-like [Rhagoletis zephyria]|uniref:indole-3-acetaldehyde oxidase-like n=1 Tax=Rhagoletis zephyria TaxID=28612 RepID=UPI0008117AA1|nr:PREDICTED: indole-3-acetaldehyde oxidase-like [Rhagoletis zephyria]
MTTEFVINGTPYTVNLTNFPPDITLNTYIREHAQLTATKFMCLEGGCGACVCAVKGKHPVSGETRTWSVNSCLTLLNTCAGWEIITDEGIGNKHIGYHPIQKRLAKMNGTQCGFCSPGFVMNMYALLESKGGKVTMAEVENAFGGNICRCTGYRPILDAMKSFAVDSTIDVPEQCRDIEDFEFISCPKTGLQCAGSCHKPLTSLVYADGTQWFWPRSLSELFDALSKIGNDEFMLVAGNTAHGVYRRSLELKHYIDVNAVSELKQHAITNDKLTLGGNLSLTEAMEIFLVAAENSGFEYCQQLWQHFDLIANVPVRNTGTLAGNISIKKFHPEFPSDIFITFEALDVQVIITEDASTRKTIPIKEYLGLSNNKIAIIAFEFKPYPKDKFIFHSYKVMPRAQNAHAYVNAAFLLDMDVSSGKVNRASICFGGIHPDFVHATAIELGLTGQNLYENVTVLNVFKNLKVQLTPDAVLPDASPDYRRTLAAGLLYKSLLKIVPADKVKEQYISGGNILQRPLSSGMQTFETNEKNYPVTQAVEKVEAIIQCSGEATYMNDTLTSSNSVYCAFANATKVGATIEEIDASEVLQTPGVIAFYSAKDIPGKNLSCDPTFGYDTEEIFCGGIVKYYDQPLGMVVAVTSDIANRAASKVKVTYSNSTRNILPTTADVFEAKEFSRIHMIKPSELDEIQMSEAPDITDKGIFEIGGQYHFTMEPQTTIAVPFEEGLQVWTSTQWMDHTQCVISKMLQVKANDVQLKVRRLGGGYGSKISRGNQVACAASLAAYKLNCPARFVQTIESMMNSNGKRWGCRSDYEFHIKANGKIVGLKNIFYQDAGCTLNENPIKGHSVGCAKNCYQLTDMNTKVVGEAVLTDAPSSTWCRAPGSVEGIAMIENILEHIAFEANIDPADARLANLKPGNKMGELLPRFIKSTEYRERRKEIDNFNNNNRWIKRGLGLSIMEYPVFLFGQYPATVSVYHVDGTVVISHGGIEMGQGMNTKIAQVAAHILGIPLSFIKIESSDTINGANSMVTGGAVGSESLCFAVRKACETLNERLKPVKDELGKDGGWLNVVQRAWGKAINLIVSDHYKKGDMENYNVYGLALTEIEVDILTGNNQIKRVDILEDAGESLSPYIDIGQVEGSFVMILGYWLTEQLIYDRQTGQLLTNRTWNYKPPGAKDIPIDFRIELLQKNPNPAGFMRSKATGEPPCCLAISSIFAIQHALQSARKDAGLKREWVRLGAPTTPEKIVLNAGTDTLKLSLV